MRRFEESPQYDVLFFKASTYTDKPLKNYPDKDFDVLAMPALYTISALEMACKRQSVQGFIRFDERFGLGTKFLTCGEEEVWLEDALRAGLKLHYFPDKIIETSTMLKKSLIYIDAGVQRSRGAIAYYKHGNQAWWTSFCFALQSAKNGYCHFLPLMRHLAEGIRYMKRTTK